MLVPALVFAATFGLALGASRLRSVAGLAGLVAAAYAGTAAEPRPAALAVLLPAGLALLGDRAWWPGERRAIEPDRLVQEENPHEYDSPAMFG